MKQEDKELLLKDLCARLSYGVKCRFEITNDTYKTKEFSSEGSNGLLVDFDEIWCYWLNEGFVIPYLRPMSSMTEDEGKELEHLFCEIDAPCWVDTTYGCVTFVSDNDFISTEIAELYTDWLNAHYFDYRGLIEKGLALEAPKDMYNVK